MKRMVESLTEAEKDRIYVAFDAEQRRALPAGWKVAEAHPNAACFAHIPSRIQVIQEVELHDDGHLWLHVSVSINGRTKTGKQGAVPGWYEMCEVKRVFIGAHRKAYQVHPAEAEHYSEAEVLHLWCPMEHEPIPDLRHPTGKL